MGGQLIAVWARPRGNSLEEGSRTNPTARAGLARRAAPAGRHPRCCSASGALAGTTSSSSISSCTRAGRRAMPPPRREKQGTPKARAKERLPRLGLFVLCVLTANVLAGCMQIVQFHSATSAEASSSFHPQCTPARAASNAPPGLSSSTQAQTLAPIPRLPQDALNLSLSSSLGSLSLLPAPASAPARRLARYPPSSCSCQPGQTGQGLGARGQGTRRAAVLLVHVWARIGGV